MEFKEYRLEGIALNITDGTHSTVKDNVEGDCYLLSCKNIKNGKVNITISDRRICFETLTYLRKRTKLSKDDILITTVGTIGEMAIVRENKLNYDFQRSVGIIKPDKEKVIPHFLYYSLLKEKNQINTLVKGAVQKCLFINDMKQISLLIPSLENQKKIVKILSDIDGKIEINNKINDNLQKISQELYKSWFVDFEFPNEDGNPYKSSGGKMIESELGLIPEGWEVKKLKDILIKKKNKISNYEDWKDLQLIDLSIMPQFNICIEQFNSGSAMTSNIYKLEKKDILFGSIRPYFGKAGFSPINGAVTGTVYCYNTKKKKRYEFLLLLTTSNKFIDYTVRVSKGTKMPIISWEDFVEYELPLPNDKILDNFSQQIHSIVDYLLNNVLTNNELKKLRNTLVPKLMSGEINLDNIEI